MTGRPAGKLVLSHNRNLLSATAARRGPRPLSAFDGGVQTVEHYAERVRKVTGS